MKILIVEDEENIAEIIGFNLSKNGYEWINVDSGEKALSKIEHGEKFDLILLDLMLAGMDGIDFCKLYRSRNDLRQIPIIMLTARSEESDIVSGLEFGANDYITKPFSPRILIARIRAQLRQNDSTLPQESKLKMRDISMDTDYHGVHIGKKIADLTANEFSILEMFMRSPGKVFSRDAIIRNLHGEGYAVTDRAIDVSIVNLRKKLGKNSDMIETVRGVGYRFSKE